MRHKWNLVIYFQNCCPEHPLLDCCLPLLQSVFNIKDPETPVTLFLFTYIVPYLQKRSKPFSHLQPIVTQNLSISLTPFAKLDQPHTKYMRLACLQHQAQLSAVTKNQRQKQALQLSACFTQKLRAQSDVYLWISLFRPQMFSPSSPLPIAICS